MSRTLVILALLSLPAAGIAAQAADSRRPRLAAGADTNDARSYYNLGLTLVEREPRAASVAFQWTSRLDPGWAEALYARRVAEFLADKVLLIGYIERSRSHVTSRDAQRLDSLEYRAQMINPFFLRDLDRTFIAHYITASVAQDIRRQGGRLDERERFELDHVVDTYLRTGTRMRLRGVLAASERQFPEALDLLKRALAEDRDDQPGVHMERARVFFTIGNHDSALVSVQQALAQLRQEGADRLQRVYESRELFEHAIGMIQESRRDVAAAREAYGRSLQENLGYYPAHVRLGLLALAAGDTATATQELDLAVQVAPDEPLVRMRYAALLAQLGRLDSATTQFRRAADLEPYYALPHYYLGRIAEAGRQREPAIEAYRAFLARASQADPRRADVAQRLADLTAN